VHFYVIKITIKCTSAQQAKPYNNYTNTKVKLLKTKAAIWFNNVCRNDRLRPKYISLKINGHAQQDRRTKTNAIRFRITQEIKFQYKKKQYLNQQLYQSHLECANYYGGMWQHMHLIIDQQLHNNMETQYHTLNKKLDALSNDKSGYNKVKTNQFQPKVINLSNTHLTKEQTDILSLGHSYAIEMEPKKYINELIIRVDTEVAIRQLEPNIQNAYRHLAAKQIKQILNSNRHNTHHKRQQYSINQIKKSWKVTI
jgi:hypothetical protein